LNIPDGGLAGNGIGQKILHSILFLFKLLSPLRRKDAKKR
jgi:hypothetical protein